MSIGSVFSKVGGFFTGLLPTIMQFSEAITMVLALLKVGVNQNDVSKIETACDALDAVADEMSDLQGELREFSLVVRNAIQENSDGGKDLTGLEIKGIAEEAADIPQEIADITKRMNELLRAIQAAV